MAINKPRRDSIINEIIVLLSANATYTEIFASNSAKWGISRRTFDGYIKLAAETHKEQQRLIQAEIMKQSTAEAKKRLKNGIYSQEEIVKKTQKIFDTAKRDSDRLNAAKLLCDILGYKAPIKNEIEISATPIFNYNPLIDGINPDQPLLNE